MIRYCTCFLLCVLLFHNNNVYGMRLSDSMKRARGLLPLKSIPVQSLTKDPIHTPPKSITPDQPVSKVEEPREQQQLTPDVSSSSSEMSSGSSLVPSLPSTSSPTVNTVEIGVGTDDLAHQLLVRTMETQTTEIPQESRNPSTTLTMNLHGRTSAHFSIDISDSTSTTFYPEKRNSVFPMFHHSDLLAATPGIQHSRNAPATCEEDNVQFQEVIMHDLMEFRTKITELEEQIGEMKYNLKELTEQLKILMVHFKKAE